MRDKKRVNKRVLIILGDDQQVLPMIKGFHDLGCFVCVYCKSVLDVGYVSRYKDAAIREYYNMKDPEGTERRIIEVIENSNFELIVPTNDFVATVLSKNKDRIPKGKRVAVNNWNSHRIACDKYLTMKTCKDIGIPCPKTCVVHDLEELNYSEWLFPLIIKPRVGYGAHGFFIIKNKDDLEQKYAKEQQQFGEMLIQEYIPAGGRQFQVEIVIDEKGEIANAIVLDKLRWYPLNGGSSTINKVVKNDTIVNNCATLLRSIGWKGYASLDMIEDVRDNAFKVLEINPRINGTVKVCFKLGIDISLQMIECAFGLPISHFEISTEKDLYIRHFHKDVLWFMKSKKRFHTSPNWFSWKNTTDEIIDFRNPLPMITYSISSIGKLLFHQF